jgi:hypothetical protein
VKFNFARPQKGGQNRLWLGAMLARFLQSSVQENRTRQFGTRQVWCRRSAMLHATTMLLFACAGGLTLSSISINLYRLVGTVAAEQNPLVYYPVIAVAGPSVLLENAARSLRARTCSAAECAVAMVFSVYWSGMLGLLGLGLYIAHG